MKKYYIRVTCSNKPRYSSERKCGKELNTSVEMTQKEIQDSWMRMVLTAGFNTPRCLKCKYSTWSDLNIGSDLNICQVGSKKALNKEKFLHERLEDITVGSANKKGRKT